MTYEWTAELWEYPGEVGNWYFVTLPKNYSDEIKLISSGQKRGFGSVRVQVTIGGSVWKTSVFPDSKSGCYMLPIKKAVRINEDLSVGVPTNVVVALLAGI